MTRGLLCVVQYEHDMVLALLMKGHPEPKRKASPVCILTIQ